MSLRLYASATFLFAFSPQPATKCGSGERKRMLRGRGRGALELGEEGLRVDAVGGVDGNGLFLEVALDAVDALDLVQNPRARARAPAARHLHVEHDLQRNTKCSRHFIRERRRVAAASSQARSVGRRRALKEARH